MDIVVNKSTIEIEVKDIKMKFKTSAELFSPKGINRGTLAMLSIVNFSRNDKVLDLGCGYGVVGILAAKIIGDENVIMTDKLGTAVQISRENAILNGVPNIRIYQSDGFRNLDEKDFALILLYEAGFEVEHENLYYICDMKEKELEYLNNSHIEVGEIEDNKQKFILYDENKNLIGNAEIKYIDSLTGLREKDTIYLVCIGIHKDIKGKGLGTEFLNHIIHYCLTKGYRYLHTDTAINNKIAQNFYIRNGFIDKGITRSYICRG